MPIELISNELTDTNIRILQESTCPSLSERTSLVYQISCNEQNDILLRILSNKNGNGKFNQEWVPVGDMLELIYESKKPFSWKVLHPLVTGKSVNTACFLLAALKNEGLLQPLDRLYEQKSSADFQGRMKELIQKPATKDQSAPDKKNRKTAKKGAKP